MEYNNALWEQAGKKKIMETNTQLQILPLSQKNWTTMLTMFKEIKSSLNYLQRRFLKDPSIISRYEKYIINWEQYVWQRLDIAKERFRVLENRLGIISRMQQGNIKMDSTAEMLRIWNIKWEAIPVPERRMK